MGILSLLESLSAVSDLVAAIAVVISLVYVAKQLHQNTNALKANAAWDSEIAYGNANLEWAHDRDNSHLSAKMMSIEAKIDDFDEAEIAQMYFIVRGVMQLAQAQWWLWKSGNLPDELWAYRRLWAKNYTSAAVVASVWETERSQHIFAREFIADIDAVDQKGELSFSPTPP